MWVSGCSTTGCQDLVLSHLCGIAYPELSNLHIMSTSKFKGERCVKVGLYNWRYSLFVDCKKYVTVIVILNDPVRHYLHACFI